MSRQELKRRNHKRRQRRSKAHAAAREAAGYRVMFWNAGKENPLRDNYPNVLAFMEDNKIDVRCFMETHLYQQDLSNGVWTWLRGPEVQKSTAHTIPPRGLGVFVRKKYAAGAAVVCKGKNSMWVRLQGEKVPLYVCATHVPLDSKGRNKTLEEIASGYEQFQSEGAVILGGDFNARCGLNGDTVQNHAGTELRKFCKAPSRCFVILNELDLCHGQFTSERWRKGQLIRTTIDYCLAPPSTKDMIRQLRLVSESELGSDHYPLVLDLGW